MSPSSDGGLVRDACEVVLTRSGARAMLDRASGEVMHPIVGPLVEAERLYIVPSRLEARLREPSAEPLVLLDVGLGAGSLAAAAIEVRHRLPTQARSLELISFERSLDAFELALRAEHASAFGWRGPAHAAARALVSAGGYHAPGLRWQLRHADLLESLPRERAHAADIVFWDPFSPDANPELWTLAAFRAARRACRDGATLHTYSGATRVRSALLLAGFHVGIGELITTGKHATVASLDPAALAQPLDQRWLARLARSSAPFPPDAPADAIDRVRAAPQFA